MTGKVRLQKFLSAAGVCSRREGERFIASGRVKVNGRAVTELGSRIDPERDRVEVDGKAVLLRKTPLYIALNKPKGYVTSCRQPRDRTVMELIGISERVYPIGRLDKDSTGLLLLTNDGRLHHRLSHPSFDHEKEYDVSVAAPIPEAALRRMSGGIILDGAPTRRAKVDSVSATRFRITLKEGKNRQIRRMVQALGNKVSELKRIRVSGIRLGMLAEGKWRYLTEREKTELLKPLAGEAALPPKHEDSKGE
jgi:pseudouridine synthase